MSRIVVRSVIVATVLVAVVLIAWMRLRTKPVSVVVGEVDSGRVERSVANTRAGTVTACRRAKLSPNGGGQIASLPVHEGDRVKPGQILLELWSEDSAAQARAAEQQTRTAAEHANEACAGADVAERDAERARKLHADGLLPDDQLDRAVTTAKSLRSGCGAARTNVAQAQAQWQAARATLTRTFLRAPFAGVIAKISGEVGEFATPSPPGIPTPPAVDLIDDSCMYVSAPIDEVDVSRVRVGQPAAITIDAIPGKKFAGRVRRIAPYVLDVEKQARTADVEVEFVDPADIKALLVGYSADVEIILDVRENAVRIPTQALLEGNRVLVFNTDSGRLEERHIEPGIANWAFTEVRSGVRRGEKIVLSTEREGVVAGARAIADRTRNQ